MTEHLESHEIISIASLETRSSFRVMEGRLTLVFVLQGSGGTVYMGLSGGLQQFVLEEGSAGYWISIDVNGLGGGFENMVNTSGLHIGAEAADELHWLIMRIRQRVCAKGPYETEILTTYVSLLLLRVKAEMKDELVLVAMNRKGMLLKDFFALLENAFATAKTVDYYANKLCVSPKHLTNVIKLESGYPTSWHIHQRIVAEAKRIARVSGANLKQIAFELGYEDAAAFSKLFKRVTGQNFSVYKGSLSFAYRQVQDLPDKQRHTAILSGNMAIDPPRVM